ncbi:MAG: hypothetical protein EOO48_09595 [Flavobacterium sp.]|nr:MAG: hypothetical protein EOO48_09595 [Flavobacterium sp.]
MTVTRNSGTPIVMDANDDDGKYMMIQENNVGNEIALVGYNTTTTDFGIYGLAFPKTVSTGTYNLVQDGTYTATVSSSSDQQFVLTSGTMTVTSHSGNNIVGTFSYAGHIGASNISIGGSFNITTH